MNPFMRWSGLWLLLLAAPFATFASGLSVGDLQAAGRLQVNSTLNPEDNIVPGQRVRLTLEIATDTWFTGGTHISIPEVPGLVILQTEQFAANATETRNSTTWVIQRWTLDVFPQRAGDFTVGPIPLDVQVNGGSSGDTRGGIESPRVAFSVTVPGELDRAKHWVASPEFTVSQQFDRSLDDLVAGDAFEQEVRFEASDVQAMMLPTYNFNPQAGIAAYPAPPVLDNSSNRGQTRASRSIRISYVVEQPGEYLLKERDYFWWNTQRGELELLTLPETRINVAGASSVSTLAGKSEGRHTLIYAGGLLLLAVFLALLIKLVSRMPWQRLAALQANITLRWRTLRAPALASRLNPGAAGPRRSQALPNPSQRD